MKTQKEINEEIKRLNKLIEQVPQYNFFSEDNHEKINAQIEVLENDMDDDEINERWAGEDEVDINDHAITAACWRDDVKGYEEAPSKDWQSLVKNKMDSKE